MSMGRSFEAQEEVKRHLHDMAERLAQCFTGLILSHITPPPFPWPKLPPPNPFEVEFSAQNFIKKDFGLALDNSGINGVTAIFDIGNRIGQAGLDFGAGLNSLVQQFFRRLPVLFHHDKNVGLGMGGNSLRRTDVGITLQADLESIVERFKDYGFPENGTAVIKGLTEDDIFDVIAKALKHLSRSQCTINSTSTYDSRTRNIERSVVAMGDIWRIEASQDSSTSGNETLYLFLVQSLMYLQFPNGQVMYASGEGLSTSVFLPLCGGLLQAQCHYPGEMKLSFSCKFCRISGGTRIMLTLQWPDKSFAWRLEHALAWKRSGFMLRATVQFSTCPTFGGSCPGMRMEFTYSIKDELNLTCGCALTMHRRILLHFYQYLSAGPSKTGTLEAQV